MAKYLRAGSETFDIVALPHLDAAFRAAFALCGQAHEAEDLVQTTFVKALERFDSFEPGTDCKSWLLQILRNTWIDKLRHRKIVGVSVSIEDTQIADKPVPEDITWSDARDILEAFSDDQVINALGELPDEQRLALFLADVEQLGHQEIANIMDVPVGTIKSRTSRARATLKKRLMAHAKDLGLMGRKR